MDDATLALITINRAQHAAVSTAHSKVPGDLAAEFTIQETAAGLSKMADPDVNTTAIKTLCGDFMADLKALLATEAARLVTEYAAF